ncbi:hypothetical protein MYX65_10750 [Acidobacteria bacterium AH-259-L09]|nr:hypothetical protein [Acidobacteria bacterium AH-259-L09]
MEEKVRSLAENLEQIEKEIRKRQQLSKNLIYQIYEHYCLLKSKLLGLYFWEPGANPSIEVRRSALEKQLDTLKQEVRKEQTQCWQDLSNLKKEFRNWFKQYCDLVQRVKLITPSEIGTDRRKRFPIQNEQGKFRTGLK